VLNTKEDRGLQHSKTDELRYLANQPHPKKDDARRPREKKGNLDTVMKFGRRGGKVQSRLTWKGGGK